ncbi:hypothetical protein M0R45_002846 [Rubus argutus]|uniref:Uncharacterized protein n=1 Tax=Rubus argutus TaxID=59490 RepID=A0AAW1VRD7_RUBAR
MGYIYELMDAAKEKIAFNLQRNLDIINLFGIKLMLGGHHNFISRYMLPDTILILNFGEENFSNVCEVKKGCMIAWIG